MLVVVSFLLVAHSLSVAHCATKCARNSWEICAVVAKNILRGEWNVANKLFIKFFLKFLAQIYKSLIN